jgi:hypothetical protein
VAALDDMLEIARLPNDDLMVVGGGALFTAGAVQRRPPSNVLTFFDSVSSPDDFVYHSQIIGISPCTCVWYRYMSCEQSCMFSKPLPWGVDRLMKVQDV